MTDSDNQPPSKRAREALANVMSVKRGTGPSTTKSVIAGVLTGESDNRGVTVKAALRAIDAATSTLLDEIKARVRGLKREAVVRETPGTFSENKGRNAALNEVLAAIKEVRHG